MLPCLDGTGFRIYSTRHATERSTITYCEQDLARPGKQALWHVKARETIERADGTGRHGAARGTAWHGKTGECQLTHAEMVRDGTGHDYGTGIAWHGMARDGSGMARDGMG